MLTSAEKALQRKLHSHAIGLDAMASKKSQIRQIPSKASVHFPAKIVFACILSVAIPLAPVSANVFKEVVTEGLPTAAKEEVIMSAIKVFLSAVVADGAAFVPDAVRNFIINNFDNISISVSKQVQMEVMQPQIKLGANILASAIVDAYVDYATKQIVADMGYGLGGATTAAVNEHIIRLGANIVMSGGNPADVALAQSMVLANVGVDLVEGSVEAVRSAYAADLSKIKSQYAEARLIATKRIMRGESAVDTLRAYDDDIASIRDSFTLKLGTAVVRGKFFEAVDELEELHLGQIRNELWLLRQTPKASVVDQINFELTRALEEENKIGDSFDLEDGTETSPEEDDVEDNSLVVKEDGAGNVVIGNNAGTNIIISPTPVETAAERAARLQREADKRARVERERLAAIDSLIATRNTLSIVRLDAKARIQNSQNRLTVLRFNELEKVQNISGIVDAEIARLRSIRSTSALSSADETRFQNLLAYQVTLENEQDRIARDITASEAAVAQYQAALDQAVASLATNGQQLTSNGYSLNTYTPPNFDPVGLIDWSSYTYDLPPFVQTEVPTSDIVNVVVSTVSLPVTSGTIRNSGALVSEDGGTIRYAFWGVDKALTQKLDGFNHIYYGIGDGGLEWVYGEATTPEQFALRTGTAVFNGGLSGYYAHGDQNSNTVYRDSVNGNLNLNIDFATNRLTGGGQVNINNAARTESLSFSLNEAAITETGGLTRSLGFNSNATLLDGASGNGNFSGTLYGADSSEAAGSFAFDLNGGFAAGLWAAGENYNPDESRYIGRITTQGLSVGIYDAEIYSGDGVGQASDTYTDVPVAQGAGGGQVRLVNKFDAGSYQHTSWGDWVANSKTIPNFSEGGYFVTAETSITPSSVIENKTGTASYSGNIIGDYVSNGTRQDAVGQINLTADFSSDKIQGQMQFGHGGAGTNAGGPISPVANLVDIPIDGNGNFAQSATNQNTGNGLNAFGVSGFFTGPDAEEMGGTAWMSLNDGAYNGVFRAKQ